MREQPATANAAQTRACISTLRVIMLISLLYVDGDLGVVHAGVVKVLRFDTIRRVTVLIVTDTGRLAHGHTDGYDGLGLVLNRSVKLCM